MSQKGKLPRTRFFFCSLHWEKRGREFPQAHRAFRWGMGLGLNRVVCELEKKKTGTEMKKTPILRGPLCERGWFFVGAAGRSRVAFLFPPILPKVWPVGNSRLLKITAHSKLKRLNYLSHYLCMIIKKVRNITLKVFIVFILLWGGLWSYYQIALSWNYFGKIGYYGPDTSQGMIAKSLQDDMEKYRNTHGTYPKIGEYCQDILVLKPYFGESTHGNFKYQYGYQWFLPYLYPETNILLHPLALWKFSVSVKDDGSAYVFRVEDRNDPLAGIMHIVARYIVRADLSNERILSLSPEGSFFPKRTSLISGTVFGCDCTGLNYCVGGNYRAQYQSPHNN